MLIEQPPVLFRKLYPGALWRVNPEEHAVYLTFDDGPIPEVTPWVLRLLEQYGVKATFFLIGAQVEDNRPSTTSVALRTRSRATWPIPTGRKSL